MTKAAKAREYLQKAYDIQHASTSVMLKHKQKLTAELSAIGANNHLSGDGKTAAKAEAKRKHATELLKEAHTNRQAMRANLQKAIREADAAIYAGVPKPDATTLSRFEARLRDIKTELMLTTRATAAYDKLKSFVDGVSDPYLAGLVRDQFGDISGTILASAGPDAAKLKLQLSQTFEHLKSGYESDDVKIAREVLETAKAFDERGRYFGILEEQAGGGTFGVEYNRYWNDTESFFEANPKDKPADWVDPEKAKPTTATEKEAAEYAEAMRSYSRAVEEGLAARRAVIEIYDKQIAALEAKGN
jgi:hypothetical protein